jgi:hypothetical protein
VQLANSNEAPLRLILGVDAEMWRHLTVSTVFEDAESIPELPIDTRAMS